MSRLVLIFFMFLASPTFAADSLEQLVRDTAALKLNLFGDELLEPEQAFEFSASVKNGNTLYVSWEIAPNYYLYREKIKLELVNSEGVKLGDYIIPNGLPKHDEAFGDVEVLSEDLNFNVPLWREDHGAQTVKLRAYFQGCAERGVCYPPMTKDVMLELPVAQQLVPFETVAVQIQRAKSSAATLFLLGSLLIITSVYFNVLEPLPEKRTALQKLGKGIGLVMLIYGVLLLTGGSLGNDNVWQPLRSLTITSSH
ncbi:MAG: protein-disulfide reductase DsbD N-terminal domain-containing protein [Methylococcales bacterium]|nr:protein-disulfide reductase DsbD N-terminal domain-containing protein [Methylococcales bacterium]